MVSFSHTPWSPIYAKEVFSFEDIISYLVLVNPCDV